MQSADSSHRSLYYVVRCRRSKNISWFQYIYSPCCRVFGHAHSVVLSHATRSHPLGATACYVSFLATHTSSPAERSSLLGISADIAKTMSSHSTRYPLGEASDSLLKMSGHTEKYRVDIFSAWFLLLKGDSLNLVYIHKYSFCTFFASDVFHLTHKEML